MKILLVFLLFLVACSRTSIKNRVEAFRYTKEPVTFTDSYSKESLITAINESLMVINKKSEMDFGVKKISSDKYCRFLELLVTQIKTNDKWSDWLRNNVEILEVYGDKDWSDVHVTGYYVPYYEGSLVETERFSSPLYKTPRDLMKIDFRAFLEDKNTLVNFSTNKVRVVKNKIVPYYDRKAIESERKLKNQNNEIVWLEPLDAFYLQIQGSGIVELPNGEIKRVGYAEQNGYSFVPVGRFLKEKMPHKKITMQVIRDYYLGLNKDEREDFLNKNPSYVFFQELKGEALTSSGAHVTGQRTIATDKSFFPKGALAYLDIAIPVADPAIFEKRPRLVVDQDVGGAIKGPHRVDLFFGAESKADRHLGFMAGAMNQHGHLYYLIPKDYN